MSNSALVAAVSMVSFAIQQFLQLLDPLISHFIEDGNKKKAMMGLLSFFLGLLVVNLVDQLMVLKAATDQAFLFLDPIVSALVVGAGT